MTVWATGEMATMGWLSHRELVALGWTLLHFLWQGAAIAIVYSAWNRLTRLARQALRYSVALAALLLMPLSVVATFAYEMEALQGVVVVTHVPQGAVEAGAQVISAAEGRAQGVLRDTVLTRMPASLVSIGKEHASKLLHANADALLPWVDAVWILGVLLLATRGFGGWLVLQQIRRKTHGILPAEVERSFERIKQQLAIHQRVLLRVSDEVISPFAMGLWRSTVIVPMSILLDLSPEELEAVFAHELAHIRRLDYLCNLIQIAIESALFFHPAVWWLSRTVRDRREVCCDAIAVATCADAVLYARALLHLEERRTAQLELAVALKGRPGTLLQRIQLVLGEENTMGNGMNNGVRIAVAGAVVFGLLLAPKISTAVAAAHIAPVQASRAQASPVQASPVQASSAQTTGSTLASEARAKDAQPAADPGPAPRATLSPSPLMVGTSGTQRADLKRNAEQGGTQVAALKLATPELWTTEATPLLFAPLQSTEEKPAGKGPSYIDGMRAAGYPLDLNNDLNALISLKSLGVTPEYAKAMGEAGMGKPTVHELISLKSLGVTPEYLSGLKHSGIEPKNFHEVVSEKALGITPEYATAMKQSGFGDMDLQALISLKAQGITPEYATWLRKQYPQASVDELRRAAIFHLDQAFVEKAKAHGMDGNNLDKLIHLKISGLVDE
jgi:beta-lactamase regulating signal transducer with metallopeptidase domain